MKYGQLNRQYEPGEQSIRTTLAGLKQAPEGASSAQSRKHRILCVDDEIEGTRIRGEILVEQGYSVVLYHSPLAALRCDLSLFDLAIVDFQMPGLNGRELLLRMRALGARFPVVLLTGAVDALSHENRILFARCIDKGGSVQHLLDIIADFIDPNQIPDFGMRSLTHSQPTALRNQAIATAMRSRGISYRWASSERPMNGHKAYKVCVRIYFEIAVVQPRQKVVVNQ